MNVKKRNGRAAKKDAKAVDLERDTVDAGEHLTTNQGLVMGDDQNSLKAGLRGPTLLEDFHFREKITHFDHERIPERVVHARGAAAHGYFQVYEPLTDLSKAGLFQDPAKRTPVFVRFSTVAGSRGSAAAGRARVRREVLHG
jgi:catalase